MTELLIKVKDQADKQCEKDIVGAAHWNLKEIDVFRKMGEYHRDHNVRGTVIDDYYNFSGTRIFRDVMPIWKHDTLITALNRYAKVFAWEYSIVRDQVRDMKKIQHHEKGFSSSKEFKWNGSIPETMYGIIKRFFPYYLTKKGMVELKKIIPQIFV